MTRDSESAHSLDTGFSELVSRLCTGELVAELFVVPKFRSRREFCKYCHNPFEVHPHGPVPDYCELHRRPMLASMRRRNRGEPDNKRSQERLAAFYEGLGFERRLRQTLTHLELAAGFEHVHMALTELTSEPVSDDRASRRTRWLVERLAKSLIQLHAAFDAYSDTESLLAEMHDNAGEGAPASDSPPHGPTSATVPS